MIQYMYNVSYIFFKSKFGLLIVQLCQFVYLIDLYINKNTCTIAYILYSVKYEPFRLPVMEIFFSIFF